MTSTAVRAATFGANSATISNRYYPLSVGARFNHRGTGIINGVQGSAQVFAAEKVDGVQALKVVSTGPDGSLQEWFAQDTSGAVWRIRQYDVALKEYDEEDYLIMPANPKVGDRVTLWILDYVVHSITATVTVPAGTFADCLHLRSVDSAWPGLEEFYAPWVGELESRDPDGGYVLVSYSGMPTPPRIATLSPLPAGTVGVAYRQALSATGGTAPYHWTLTQGSLPDGLVLSDAGVISGTPTAAGESRFTVQVAGNDGRNSSKEFVLVLNLPPTAPTIVTASPLPAGMAGVAYSQTLAASGGAAPYTWRLSAGRLPAGLALGTTGVLAGTPSAASTLEFTVQVTGKDGRASTKVFGLTIAPRSYSLGGVVRLGFATGDPVPGVLVSVVRPDTSVVGTSTTGADGRFSITGVPAGTYVLRLSRDAYRFTPEGLAALQVKQDETALNFIALPQHEIVFDEIQSGQFLGLHANYLRPGQTAADAPGAGRVGNAKGILLMATRAEQAVMVAKIRLSPPDAFLQERLVVRCTDADVADAPILGGAPVWDDPARGGSATFTLDGPWPALRRIGWTAWIDLNHGETFDPAIGERRVAATGTAHVISKLGYENARQTLGLGATVAASLLNMEQKLNELFGGGGGNQAGGLRIAPAFLLAFVEGKAPTLPHAQVISNICADGTELDFNVGVPFGGNGCGEIPEYRFAAESEVGRAVRDSVALREAAMATLALRRDEIARLFRDNPTAPTIQVPLLGNQRRLDGKEFGDSPLLTFGGNDLDLALAFGTARLEAEHSRLFVDRGAIGMVRVQGAIQDLYDWEYLKHDFDTLAAKVQAGFGSLGDGGRVYRVRADFSGALFGMPVDGELALGAERRLTPDGLDLEIRLASTKGGTAVIERSRDLKLWETVSEMPVGPGEISVRQRVDGTSGGGWFYRARIRAE